MGDGCEPCDPDDGQPDQLLDEQWQEAPNCDHDTDGPLVLMFGENFATCSKCGWPMGW